jgi:hypothetical protein
MDNGGGPKAPYGGFGTFWNFVGQLGEHGSLPQVLDRSVMGNRGGSARSELYMALRFFGLMDEDKKPTNQLHALAADPTATQLKALVEQAYAPVVALGLGTATPTQVGEALVKMGTSPSTVARSRTFFLHAAEHAGIEIGKTLKTTRAPSTGPRRKARNKKPDALTPPAEDQPASKLPPLIGALVAKLPQGDWNEPEAKQWLALVAPAIAYDYGLDADKLKPSGGGS